MSETQETPQPTDAAILDWLDARWGMRPQENTAMWTEGFKTSVGGIRAWAKVVMEAEARGELHFVKFVRIAR